MSLKSKMMNIIATHPRLITFGISIAITFGISIAFGLADSQQVLAKTFNCHHHAC